jgi:hypothetical protein
MFKYFISEPTRIAITTGTQRITFPLHTGLIRIHSCDNIFKFYYAKPNIENTDHITSKIFDSSFVRSDKIKNTINNTVQLYRLADRCIVDIPRIYFKNINMSKKDLMHFNACILQTVWNDNDTIRSIEIISPSDINKFMK